MSERYANCTVHHGMHDDRRFDLLAELGGWTRNDACFRMVQLYARCTALRTDLPPPEEIRIHLGLRGEQLLVDSTLGERRPDGFIQLSDFQPPPPPKQQDPTSVVTYAVASPDRASVKVGHTRYLERRMTSLQTAHALPLIMLGVVAGDIEATAHSRLDEIGKRMRGEWFLLDDQTMAALALIGLTRGAH